MANFEEQLYCDFTGIANEGMAGKDILLAVFDETGENLLAIAGQQNLTINREKESIEVDTKTTGGWKQKLHGMKNWSIEIDGLYVGADASHKALSHAFNHDEFICLKVVDIKNKKAMFGGLAILSDYPIEAPFDDGVTYSATLDGTGPLVDLQEDDEATQMPVGHETVPGV